MDVRAILLTGPASDENARELLGGLPIALLDVLGCPVLQRVAGRLHNSRFAEVMAVVDAGHTGAPGLPPTPRGVPCLVTSGQAFWEAVQRVFSRYAQSGADLVLIVRLGAYAEVEYDKLIQAHLDGNAHITAVINERNEPLGTFLVNASRRNDVTFLLHHRLKESRTAPSPYRFRGYCNPLSTAADIRRLAVDAFFGTVRIAPEGSEIRPGVWVANGARLRNGARIVAPAFIGRGSQVHPFAVVTRCTALERHTIINEGTVLEDATVLPETRVGAGLDVAHAVVGSGHIYDLRRGIEVSIADPRLVGPARSASAHFWARTAARLTPHVSLSRLRSLLDRDRPLSAEAPATAETGVTALAAGRTCPDSQSGTD
jgi:hypothetical protein